VDFARQVTVHLDPANASLLAVFLLIFSVTKASLSNVFVFASASKLLESIPPRPARRKLEVFSA
jgi:hypothetical protein